MPLQNLRHYVAVLAVKNLEESLSFFRDKLGFELIDSFGNPTYYAEVQRDNAASLMLLHQSNFEGSTATNAPLAFYCTDVDAIYEEFIANGVEIDEPIENQEYLMREFRIKDPNGYLIVFRQEIKG